MQEELHQIWSSEYFVRGQRCFWLYNYDYFRILDQQEYTALNSDLLHYPERVFAVADLMNGDRELTACLYFNAQAKGEILIQSLFNCIEPVELKKIAPDFSSLLGTQEYSSILVEEKDKAFWMWYEGVYHDYDIERTVPKGVLPRFDLRAFFVEDIEGTFLSDHKGTDREALYHYFAAFGIVDLDAEEILERRIFPDDLDKFIAKVNAKVGAPTFYWTFFSPSAFWGIGNYNTLKSGEKQRLYEYGIIGSNSFCYLECFPSGNSLEIHIVNPGDFPMYDVTVSLLDYRKLYELERLNDPDLSDKSRNVIPIGTVWTKKISKIITLSLPKEPKQDYLAQIHARSGSYVQWIKLRKVSGKWLKAIKVGKNEFGEQKAHDVLNKIDPGYPVNENNEVQWNDQNPFN